MIRVFCAGLCALLFVAGPARAEPADVPDPAESDDSSEAEAAALETDPPRQVTGRNCLGEPKPKLSLSSLFGIKYGDWGLEHQLRIGACIPLFKTMGPLFNLSSVEAGFVMHTTPIYLMPGAYLTVAPLSILKLQVEAAPILYWPIGVSAAGYYPIDGYSSDYSKASLPAEDGATATGWYVRFGPTLQLAVPVGPIKIILVDVLRFEHFQIGPADFYFHNRNDLPAARKEWFVDNLAILMAEFRLHPNVALRVGANDQIVSNFGGKNISNAVRGVAMLNLAKLGHQVRDFTIILAAGGRTHHPVRQGDFNFIVAFSFLVDLLAKKPAEEP